MLQKLVLSAALSTLVFGCIGCGDSGPVDVSENADQQSIDEYKAMIAAEEAANAGSDKNQATPPK
jgi:hypothetical protein